MKDERKNRAENIFSQYLPVCICFIPLFPIKLNALPISCLSPIKCFYSSWLNGTTISTKFFQNYQLFSIKGREKNYVKCQIHF